MLHLPSPLYFRLLYPVLLKESTEDFIGARALWRGRAELPANQNASWGFISPTHHWRLSVAWVRALLASSTPACVRLVRLTRTRGHECPKSPAVITRPTPSSRHAAAPPKRIWMTEFCTVSVCREGLLSVLEPPSGCCFFFLLSLDVW